MCVSLARDRGWQLQRFIKHPTHQTYTHLHFLIYGDSSKGVLSFHNELRRRHFWEFWLWATVYLGHGTYKELVWCLNVILQFKLRWCNLSLRCHLQASQRWGLIQEGQVLLLHILPASQSQLHYPHAYGQRHADWPGPQPLLCKGNTHLSQADAALQPGLCVPAGEHWTGYHWDPDWTESHRPSRPASALPLSMPSTGWVSALSIYKDAHTRVQYKHAPIWMHAHKHERINSVSEGTYRHWCGIMHSLSLFICHLGMSVSSH